MAKDLSSRLCPAGSEGLTESRKSARRDAYAKAIRLWNQLDKSSRDRIPEP